MRAHEAQLEKAKVILSPIQSWSLQDHFAGRVRALEARDIPGIAALHFKVYGDKYRGREQSLRADLLRLFLDNPWYSPELPSLVFESREGEVIGCVGVLPRPMQFHGRPVTAAVTHSFMVEPGRRATLAAVHLVRCFFDGPQDLSLADVNEVSRRIWESAGGRSSLLYGLSWTRPLKPSRYILSFLRNRGMPAALSWLLDPLCRGVDLFAPMLSRRSFQLTRPEAAGEALDADALCEAFPRLAQGRGLRPSYDPKSYAWQIETLAANARYGVLHGRQVRESSGRVCGWYVYFMRPNGIAEVVQLMSESGSADAVLDRLFFEAAEAGAIAVTGQMDPALYRSLSDKLCVYHQSADSWLMLHSRDSELVHAIEAGDAFLSRLEGEWWISSILG